VKASQCCMPRKAATVLAQRRQCWPAIPCHSCLGQHQMHLQQAAQIQPQRTVMLHLPLVAFEAAGSLCCLQRACQHCPGSGVAMRC
jgi:hypothetical protein